jgi:hypothetical protein
MLGSLNVYKFGLREKKKRQQRRDRMERRGKMKE